MLKTYKETEILRDLFKNYSSCRYTISEISKFDVFKNEDMDIANKVSIFFNIFYEAASLLKYYPEQINDESYLEPSTSNQSLHSYDGVIQCIDHLNESYINICNRKDVMANYFDLLCEYNSLFYNVSSEDIELLKDKNKKTAIEVAYWNAKGNAILKKADYLDKRFVPFVKKEYQSALSYFLTIIDEDSVDSYEHIIATYNCGECLRKIGKSKYDGSIEKYNVVRKKSEEKLKSVDKNSTYVNLYLKMMLTTQNKLGICNNDGNYFIKTMEYYTNNEHFEQLRIKREALPIIATILEEMKSEENEHSILQSKILPLIKLHKNNTHNAESLLHEKYEADIRENKKAEFDSNENIEYEDFKGIFLQALLNFAIRERKNGNIEFALILFEAMLTFFDFENVDALNNKGVCLRKLGEYQEAIKTFEKIKCSHGIKFAKINILKCKMELRVYEDEIISELNKMLKINDKNIEALFHKGLFFFNRSYVNQKNDADIHKALNLFEEVRKIEPDLHEKLCLKSTYKIGDCYSKLRRFHKAIEIFKNIIKHYPNDELAHINLGWCLQNLNYFDMAIKEYKNTKPTRIDTKVKKLNNLGYCFFNKGIQKYSLQKKNTSPDYNEAIHLFTKAIDECFNEAIKLHKNHYNLYHLANCHTMRAKCYVKVNENEKATEDFKSAYDLFKESIIRDPFDENANSYFLMCLCDILVSKNNLYYCEDALCFRNISEKDNFIKEVMKELDICMTKSANTYLLPACTKLYEYITKEEKFDLYSKFSKIALAKCDEGFVPFDNYFHDEEYESFDNDKIKGEINGNMFRLYKEVANIKKECLITEDSLDDTKEKYVHYTKFEVVKILLSRKGSPKLRLWNTSHMNDLSEGEVFFKLIDEEDRELFNKHRPHQRFKQTNNTKIKPYNSNVYMTSFSQALDSVNMWVQYAGNGTGSSIMFDKDFIDVKGKAYSNTHLIYDKNSYPLYEVQYVKDAEAGESNNVVLANNNSEIIRCIKKITEIVNATNIILEKELPDNNMNDIERTLRDAVADFISNAINEVRFLFKSTDYNYEKEVRIIKSSNNAIIDEQSPTTHPRVYIELDKDVRIEELQFGPKTENINDIIPWVCATEKVNYVSKSQKTYR